MKRLHIWLSTMHYNLVARLWKRWQRKRESYQKGSIGAVQLRWYDGGIPISDQGIWCLECQRWIGDNEQRCEHIAEFEREVLAQ